MIHDTALSTMKRRTALEPGPSRLMPLPHGRVVAVGHVRRIELRQIRAFGAEVVVDDVEDDGDVQPVGGIDEGAQIVGPAVVARRRIQADAVVAPVAGAGEFGDRHQLDGRDAEVVQLGGAADALP